MLRVAHAHIGEDTEPGSPCRNAQDAFELVSTIPNHYLSFEAVVAIACCLTVAIQGGYLLFIKTSGFLRPLSIRLFAIQSIRRIRYFMNIFSSLSTEAKIYFLLRKSRTSVASSLIGSL